MVVSGFLPAIPAAAETGRYITEGVSRIMMYAVYRGFCCGCQREITILDRETVKILPKNEQREVGYIGLKDNLYCGECEPVVNLDNIPVPF